MKARLLWAIVAMVCILGAGVVWAQGQEDIVSHRNCSNCGMDRQRFDYSRMVVEFEDGTVKAVCSLRCAIDEMGKNKEKKVKSVSVADFNTKKLISADKAYWVVGGEKPGVMARVGKWAFEKKEDAEAFIKTNGGSLATFEQAREAARQEIVRRGKMMGGAKPMEGGK